MSRTELPRSKKLLEKRGYRVAIVEKWNSFAHIRQDLFGIFDLLCVPGKGMGTGVLGVQVTSGGNMSARLKKIQESDIIGDWLQSGNAAEIHDWRKLGKEGKRKLWDCRIKTIGVGDLQET